MLRVSPSVLALVLALISAVGPAVGPRLGVGLNLSKSAPRGVYHAVPGARVRDVLVTACLPVEIAVFGTWRVLVVDRLTRLTLLFPDRPSLREAQHAVSPVPARESARVELLPRLRGPPGADVRVVRH